MNIAHAEIEPFAAESWASSVSDRWKESGFARIFALLADAAMAV
jgi:hypothetical protein